MSLEKFRYNKKILGVMAFVPLFVVILLMLGIGLIESNVFALIALVIMIIIGMYYFIISIDITYGLYSYKSKVIKSKYGEYFLHIIDEGDYYKCFLFENRYWFHLNRLPIETIVFNGDIDQLNLVINNSLYEYHSGIGRIRREKDGLGAILNDWDGITDDVIRREESINKII